MRADVSCVFTSGVLALALMTLGGSAFARGPVSDDSAIALVKRTTASQLDSSLPKRSFNAWVNEKFRGWAIEWGIQDCGEGPSDPKDQKPDTLACVQVDIMQPSQLANGVASRGFHIVFLVGSEKKGLLKVPRFRSASHQQEDTSEELSSLSEVEP